MKIKLINKTNYYGYNPIYDSLKINLLNLNSK